MTPRPEETRKIPAKFSFRSILSGVLAALILQTVFIAVGIAANKHAEDSMYLLDSKLWWFATIALSFFLGRYVMHKISGVPQKSLIRWEEKD